MAAKQIMKKKHVDEEEEQVKLKHFDEPAEYEYVTIPPDGGFGWVVAFAAMVCIVMMKVCVECSVCFLFSCVTLFVMALYLLLVQ